MCHERKPTQCRYDSKRLHETLFLPQWVQCYTASERPAEAKVQQTLSPWSSHLNIVCIVTVLTEGFYVPAGFQALQVQGWATRPKGRQLAILPPPAEASGDWGGQTPSWGKYHFWFKQEGETTKARWENAATSRISSKVKEKSILQ